MRWGSGVRSVSDDERLRGVFDRTGKDGLRGGRPIGHESSDPELVLVSRRVVRQVSEDVRQVSENVSR